MASWRIRFHDKWPHLASLYASTHNLDEDGKYPDPVMGQDNVFDPSEPYGAYRYFVQPSTRSEFSIEEPGYMHRSMYKDEESRSSDYTSGDSFRRGSTCRVLLCVFLVFSFIGVVVAAITLAVLLSQTPTPLPEKPSRTDLFESKASIFARDFNEKLLDNSTAEFKQLEVEFCRAIEQMFTDSDSPVKNSFGGCEVLEFINGSVQVRYRLKLVSKSPEGFKMDAKIQQKLEEHFAKKVNEIGPWQALRFNPGFLKQFLRVEPLTTSAPLDTTTRTVTTGGVTTKTTRAKIEKERSTVSLSTESMTTLRVTSSSPNISEVSSKTSTTLRDAFSSPEVSTTNPETTPQDVTTVTREINKISTEETTKTSIETEVPQTIATKVDDILLNKTQPDLVTQSVATTKKSVATTQTPDTLSATKGTSPVTDLILDVTDAITPDVSTKENLIQLITEISTKETTSDIFDFFYYYNDTFETTEQGSTASTVSPTTVLVSDKLDRSTTSKALTDQEVTLSVAPSTKSVVAVTENQTMISASSSTPISQTTQEHATHDIVETTTVSEAINSTEQIEVTEAVTTPEAITRAEVISTKRSLTTRLPTEIASLNATGARIATTTDAVLSTLEITSIVPKLSTGQATTESDSKAPTNATEQEVITTVRIPTASEVQVDTKTQTATEAADLTTPETFTTIQEETKTHREVTMEEIVTTVSTKDTTAQMESEAVIKQSTFTDTTAQIESEAVIKQSTITDTTPFHEDSTIKPLVTVSTDVQASTVTSEIVRQTTQQTDLQTSPESIKPGYTTERVSTEGTNATDLTKTDIFKTTSLSEIFTTAGISQQHTESGTDKLLVVENVTKGISEIGVQNVTDTYDYNTSEIYYYETTTSDSWLLNQTMESTEKITELPKTTTYNALETTEAVVKTKKPTENTTLQTPKVEGHLSTEAVEDEEIGARASSPASTTKPPIQTTDVLRNITEKLISGSPEIVTTTTLEKQSTVLQETTSSIGVDETSAPSPSHIQVTQVQSIATVSEELPVLKNETTHFAATTMTATMGHFSSEKPPLTTKIETMGGKIASTEGPVTEKMTTEGIVVITGDPTVAETLSTDVPTISTSVGKSVVIETTATQSVPIEVAATDQIAIELTTESPVTNLRTKVSSSTEQSTEALNITEVFSRQNITAPELPTEIFTTEMRLNLSQTTKSPVVTHNETAANISDLTSSHLSTEKARIIETTTTVEGQENATDHLAEVTKPDVMTSTPLPAEVKLITGTRAESKYQVSTEASINDTAAVTETTPAQFITKAEIINETSTTKASTNATIYLHTTTVTTKSAESAFLDEYGEAAFIDEYVPTSINITEETSVISASNETHRGKTTKTMPVATTVSLQQYSNKTVNASEISADIASTERPDANNVTVIIDVTDTITEVSGNKSILITTSKPIDRNLNTSITTVQNINVTDEEQTLSESTVSTGTVVAQQTTIDVTVLPLRTDAVDTERNVTQSTTTETNVSKAVTKIVTETIPSIDRNITKVSESHKTVTDSIQSSTESETISPTVKNETDVSNVITQSPTRIESITIYDNSTDYYYNYTDYYYEYYNVTSETPVVNFTETREVHITEAPINTETIRNETVQNRTDSVKAETVTEATTLHADTLTTQPVTEAAP